MKDFLNRNKPVFIIALITVIVFVTIIVLAQKAPATQPSLKEIQNVDLVSTHSYKKGASNPKVTLVEFSDFQCPACKAFYPVVNQVYEKYKNDLQLVYRNFPLPQHENAKLAAIAAQAAGTQGKFWEYADLLYNNQDNLKKKDLIKYAEETGMNVEKFKKDLDDGTYAAQVEDDIQTGLKIGINATPTFILNNVVMTIDTPNDFDTQIADALKKLGNNPQTEVTPTTTPNVAQTTQTPNNDNKNVTPTADVVIIDYTTEGFVPNNLKLKLGQMVKFVNTTDKSISIRQLIFKYRDFGAVKDLAPKEEYEFALTEPDLWTFKEDSVRHYGSIFVSKE